MPNRAVVMSGGGAKGAFQVGALDYLINEEGMDFQVISGVPTGSLNATILAQASKGELKEYQRILREIWFQIGSDRSIYLKRFLGEVFLFLLKNSLYNPDPVKALLRRHASPENTILV